MALMTESSPKYVTCCCQNCEGHIEFPSVSAGQVVACPHCGQQTKLKNPRSNTWRFLLITVGVVATGAAIFATAISSSPKTSARSAEQHEAPLNIAVILTNAQNGDVSAELSLGWAYMKGEGVKKDHDEATKWYVKVFNQEYRASVVTNNPTSWWPSSLERVRKIAEAGDIDAQLTLGPMFGDKDHGEAEKWFRQLAGQNNLEAQYKLAELIKVYGTTADALEWYRKSAEGGYLPAQKELGSMYESGFDIPKDEAESAKWYNMAAEQGDPLAQWRMGGAYEFGQGVAKSKSEAFAWYLKSAQQGFPLGQFYMGLLYDDRGTGWARDYDQAITWYRRAADQNFVEAKFRLGVVYCKDGPSQNYEEAFRWSLTAAKQTNTEAQLMVGNLYCRGQGVPKDFDEADKWYHEVASGSVYSDSLWREDSGNDYVTGLKFDMGEGAYTNSNRYEMAAYFYRKAAGHTGAPLWDTEPDKPANPLAEFRLGLLFQKGTGVPLDTIEAYKWFSLAASEGLKSAEAAKQLLALNSLQTEVADRRTEGVYDIAMRDLRLFRGVRIVSEEPNGLVVVFPGEIASTKIRFVDMAEFSRNLFGYVPENAENYDQLENKIHASEESTIPATAATQSDGGVKIQVISASAKVIETNRTYWKWSWKVVIKNNTARMAKVEEVKVQLKDKDGYVIDDDAHFDIQVDPNKDTPVTGDVVIDLPGGKSVTSVSARLL